MEREVVQHNTTHGVQYIQDSKRPWYPFDSPSISSISGAQTHTLTHSKHTRECGPSSFHFFIHVLSDSCLASLLSSPLNLSLLSLLFGFVCKDFDSIWQG
jgi:hypothetical protein